MKPGFKGGVSISEGGLRNSVASQDRLTFWGVQSSSNLETKP